MHEYNELNQIEKPTIDLFTELGYEHINAMYDQPGLYSQLGRQSESEVLLVKYLYPAIAKINQEVLASVPEQSADLITQAIAELQKDRSDRVPAEANREVYNLLKEGVQLPLVNDNQRGTTQTITLKYIDWDTSENHHNQNHYLLVSQLWIRYDIYKRRPDLIGYVNGIPLIFIELKAIHERLEHAYNDNFRDYKRYIPQLFWYNALIILSNGRESRIGSLTSGWEHLSEWKRIKSEDEAPNALLDTMIRGTCQPERLLDIIENFTLFSEAGGGLNKIIARNHQYLGVNKAIEVLKNRQPHQEKLGVFWHTQGSGKSYSMVFFVQKVHYTLNGSWKFLIVTDREDLDTQIYQTFKNVNAAEDKEAHAKGGKHLQQLLRENHRVIFTTIHKFNLRYLNDGTARPKKQPPELKAKKRVKKKREPFPEISNDSQIIVISDEAHRTQYSDLAQNMREALPNAAFIGFTGTPLIEGAEREETIKKFGDYISQYDFGDSIEDKTTVPLFYENRSPEIQIINNKRIDDEVIDSDLNEQISDILEKAEEDDSEEESASKEESVQRKFKEFYNIVTLEPRLEKVAEDIAQHFMRRGYRGKAMVVAIDKPTTVRMYDKVQKYWQIEIDKLKQQLQATDPNDETTELKRDKLQYDIDYMESTHMAVVVSTEQNEDAKYEKLGLNIQIHRRRMETEHLEDDFKSPNHILRIVFVCGMWMTGFDVPSLSTIYLDKPMHDHTLMQTIARANRVYRDRENGLKVNGLIVDYLGIFRNISRALAIYAPSQDANGKTQNADSLPIRDKKELIPKLKATIKEAEEFCQKLNIDLAAILAANKMNSIKLLTTATDKIVNTDQQQRQFIQLVAAVERNYNAILPDRSIQKTYEKRISLLIELVRIIASFKVSADISNIMEDITTLLSASVTTTDYVVRTIAETNGRYILPERIDLSKIDYTALAENIKTGNQAIKYDQLRGKVAQHMRGMLKRNKKRINFEETFERMIDDYNQGTANHEIHYYKLLEFMKELGEEDERHVQEGLSEEELALYDIIITPQITLTADEKEQVKVVVRILLSRLKTEKLHADWNTKGPVEAQVRNVIRDELRKMPKPYLNEIDTLKATIYEHVVSTYDGMGKSVYDDEAM